MQTNKQTQDKVVTQFVIVVVVVSGCMHSRRDDK
jgi:hypothetical protein